MLVKDFCKTLLGLKTDDAKLLIKNAQWKVKDFFYKDNLFLPDIKNPKTIVLLVNKNSGLIVDAFPFKDNVIEM